MRFLVTGGRSFGVVINPKSAADRERAARERQIAHAALSHIPITATLVHGDAPGADRLCADLWVKFGGVAEGHPADWIKDGRAGGPIRNQKMVDLGADQVLAFPGSNGTRDCVLRALKAGVPVVDATTGERIENAEN